MSCLIVGAVGSADARDALATFLAVFQHSNVGLVWILCSARKAIQLFHCRVAPHRL
jgi:hypothetical protein